MLGEQASGKSTLAQCVHFFRSLPEDFASEAFGFWKELSSTDGLMSIDALEAVSMDIGNKFGSLADIINESETFAE